MKTTMGVILLSGGKGLRLGSSTPKQYLPLNKKPIALHSYEIFKKLPFCDEMVVVADPDFHHLFPLNTNFATPGKNRQDSLYNGLEKLRAINPSIDMICIHDAARPFILPTDIEKLFEMAKISNAATLATPVTYTIKEVTEDLHIKSTPKRHTLYEAHTPQMISKELLLEGFKKVIDEQLEVTDDVSIVEAIGHRVKIVLGSSSNKKITTKKDYESALAEV